MGNTTEYEFCFIKNRTLTYNADIEGPGVRIESISLL